ncbi:Sec14p-like phosphatidylinositol transfer family protein [Striga asiatica]|uniref:Sec14p-like phosphatidylinositol transfer family protein n=1 Tax=Striga asiatica TaxID=4170 RepID=A0A5A7P3E4_STRAF|nr:Sec14p-like phosphatidylinositol transfer family protein [Striga asiatica]
MTWQLTDDVVVDWVTWLLTGTKLLAWLLTGTTDLASDWTTDVAADRILLADVSMTCQMMWRHVIIFFLKNFLFSFQNFRRLYLSAPVSVFRPWYFYDLAELVAEVKEKLEKEHKNLPIGKYGRDDEEIILCAVPGHQLARHGTEPGLAEPSPTARPSRAGGLSSQRTGRFDQRFESVLIRDFQSESIFGILIFFRASPPKESRASDRYSSQHLHQFSYQYWSLWSIVVCSRPHCVFQETESSVPEMAKRIWRIDLSEESVYRSAKTGKAYLHECLDVKDRPVIIVDASKHFPGEQEPSEDEKLCVFFIEKALAKLPHGNQEILIVIDLRKFQTQNADIKYVTFVVRFCTAKDVKEEYFTTNTVPASFRE